MNSASIVSKVWSFCTTLRDDGVGYGDYLEQLTYLIFLKMADEYARPPYGRDVGIPEDYGWTSLTTRRGAELEAHYVALLRRLGQQRGMLGEIFTKAQNKITDPAKLFRLIAMVDGTNWVMLGADVKGDIYEGLLERNAEDTKSGAGQYFTPRALIRAMVACVRPEPGKTIADPACGTGGFFLAAHDFLTDPRNCALDRDQKAFLKHATFHGNEIVAGTRRLCLMNMLLHGIREMTGETAISPADALISPPSETFDYVLANPPFGKKSSMSFTNAEGEQETDDLTYNRQDFWATTSNKQLNFVQHIRTMLKTTGPRPSSSPTTCCSRAAPARRFAGSCFRPPTCTRSCGYPPASSTRRESRRTSSFSTTVGPAPIRRVRRSGTTTTAPTCITRSSRSR